MCCSKFVIRCSILPFSINLNPFLNKNHGTEIIRRFNSRTRFPISNLILSPHLHHVVPVLRMKDEGKAEQRNQIDKLQLMILRIISNSTTKLQSATFSSLSFFRQTGSDTSNNIAHYKMFRRVI